MYISIYSRYHTITDVCTTALLPTQPSSDDDSGFRHGFRAEASLPLAQSASAVSHDTTRLCQIVFSRYFLLSDGGSPRLIKNTEVELSMKPLHLTLIGNIFVIFLVYVYVYIYIYIYIYIYTHTYTKKITTVNIQRKSAQCMAI